MAAPKGLAFIFSLTSGAPLRNLQMLSPGPSCQRLLPQTPPGLQAPTTWSPALNTEAQLGRKRKHSCEGSVVVVVVGGGAGGYPGVCWGWGKSNGTRAVSQGLWREIVHHCPPPPHSPCLCAPTACWVGGGRLCNSAPAWGGKNQGGQGHGCSSYPTM